MLRVRRNCKRIEDYDIQAQIISDRLQEKGYNIRDLMKTKEAIRNIDRESLFKTKTQNKKDYGVAFITGFTRQHKQFEKVIKEYWPLLLKDRDLRSVLNIIVCPIILNYSIIVIQGV